MAIRWQQNSNGTHESTFSSSILFIKDISLTLKALSFCFNSSSLRRASFCTFILLDSSSVSRDWICEFAVCSSNCCCFEANFSKLPMRMPSESILRRFFERGSTQSCFDGDRRGCSCRADARASKPGSSCPFCVVSPVARRTSSRDPISKMRPTCASDSSCSRRSTSDLDHASSPSLGRRR